MVSAFRCVTQDSGEPGRMLQGVLRYACSASGWQTWVSGGCVPLACHKSRDVLGVCYFHQSFLPASVYKMCRYTYVTVYDISEMYDVPAVKAEFVLLWISLLNVNILSRMGNQTPVLDSEKEGQPQRLIILSSGWYSRGLQPCCCGHAEME